MNKYLFLFSFCNRLLNFYCFFKKSKFLTCVSYNLQKSLCFIVVDHYILLSSFCSFIAKKKGGEIGAAIYGNVHRNIVYKAKITFLQF